MEPPTLLKNMRLTSFIFSILLVTGLHAMPATKEIPDLLKPWTEWATWNDRDRNSPSTYQDVNKRMSFWPSRLAFQVDKNSGRFTLDLTVYSETWVPLPGGREAWPVDVKVGNAPVPVVEHNGKPSVRLMPGLVHLEGVFRWNDIPQRIPLPREIGILTLTLDGKTVTQPAWDAQGFLWLKRDAVTHETDKDFLGAKVYSVLEDGIPLWLRTDIELIVSGKSREEQLGFVLPVGWKLAAVDSSIPVAVDDSGRMKVQVRAGKWTVHLDGFRLDNPAEFHYAPETKPVAAEQLIGFRSRPDFRTVEIAGAMPVDVSQTTFPAKWRDLPVYRWAVSTPFCIQERMRGQGVQKPEGLQISRELWLDENGAGLTFRDHLNGKMQQTWRLDVASGQDLGSVRSGGAGQLITRNPLTHAYGIEIRTREINLEATGRMTGNREFFATGWNSDADALRVTLNRPPGWRLFALFGADHVNGDWLTSWTLLDLFYLLIFTLAVFRLFGCGAALLAFVAFGLSYHEPDAPRIIWLLLLLPIALLRVVPSGIGQRLVLVWKWISVGVLVLLLAPFLMGQIQQALYPQLERHGPGQSARPLSSAAPQSNDLVLSEVTEPSVAAAPAKAERRAGGSFGGGVSSQSVLSEKNSNLAQAPAARIQTGPGVPDWTWRTATFGWNGPVQASQKVCLILIPPSLERGLTLLRILTLTSLAGCLLGARWRRKSLPSIGKSTALIFFILGLSSAHSEMPDPALINTLRDRLLEPSDAYPHAADIPNVTLTITEHRIRIDAEIHTATQTAVPLPGRIPSWSPISVMVDDKPDSALRRDDGYLWVVLPAGVHRVRVEGILPDVTEWEWTFQLAPRHISVDAPDWSFSGVRSDGTPEQQIFFALKKKTEAGAASYDRQDFQTLALIDRTLELGLVWQVHTKVTRLSQEGKALALRIPLLPGENVLSSNAVVKEGVVEVRLGAYDKAFAWESEIASTALQLVSRPEDLWVEQWRLVASPVWNIAVTGLAPVFEPGNRELIPVWHPWPGEKVEISVNRPEAILGATVTVNKGTHAVTLGNRQFVSKLDLSVRCSLGEDFLVDLPHDAEITSLMHNNRSVPVRKDGSRLIIPLHPGEQSISIGWKNNQSLRFRARASAVKLPVDSANVTTTFSIPDNRWVLWTQGPLRGPAVRFWGILATALLAGWILGRIPQSPLRSYEWMLLSIGLTQVNFPSAFTVVAWFFFLVWRGFDSFVKQRALTFNLLQLFLVGLTAGVLGIFVMVVSKGLLGDPQMFIQGNGSTAALLNWYQARCAVELPSPACYSVSIWWYRLSMLLWALWVSVTLIRWLCWAWQQFSTGGCFRLRVKK